MNAPIAGTASPSDLKLNRVLVVHYSRTGHTDHVAREIAARCHADIERIEDVHSRDGGVGYLRSAMEAILGIRTAIKPGRLNPADYDLVIVGTPVWFWGVSSPVRAWLHRHRSALRKVAVFCTCGSSGDARAMNDVERLCGQPALARLALTERMVPQCHQNPAFDRFLVDIERARSAGVSMPHRMDQAPA